MAKLLFPRNKYYDYYCPSFLVILMLGILPSLREGCLCLAFLQDPVLSLRSPYCSYSNPPFSCCCKSKDVLFTKLYYHGSNHPEDMYDRIDITTILQNSKSNNNSNNKNHTDTDENKIMGWLTNLSGLERSEPEWIGEDILEISHSLLVQEHLESLVGIGDTPQLFGDSEFHKAKFDFDWRCILLKSMPQLTEVLEFGRCNSHPLRLQLVAIPPHTSLPLHVHATGELDIPLVGELWENQSNVRLDADTLCRQPEHSIGTPLSDFASKPTPEELQIIHDDLSSRIILEDFGPEGGFHTQKIQAGECLVNQIGSIHQSFTKDKPCLLWCLGANVHGHFKPGNFHQRDGIHELTGIDQLLVD